MMKIPGGDYIAGRYSRVQMNGSTENLLIIANFQ